jgi:hypothetical protein
LLQTKFACYKLTKATLRASLSSSLLQKCDGGNAPFLSLSVPLADATVPHEEDKHEKVSDLGHLLPFSAESALSLSLHLILNFRYTR